MPARKIEVALDERVERAEVVGVDLEHLAIDGDRRLWTIEHVFFDRRRLEQGVLLLQRLFENLGLALEGDRQIWVPLGRPEKPLERPRCRQVQRIDLEHLAIEGDGGVDVADVVFVGRRAHHVKGACQRRIVHLRGKLLEDIREVREAPGGARYPVELLLGAFVRRVLLEGPGERRKRRPEVAGRVLVELRDMVQELDTPRGVVAPSHLDFVYADEPFPVPGMLVERLEQIGNRQLVFRALAESLERGQGFAVGRRTFENLAVSLDRDVDEPHLAFAQRSKPQHEGDLRLFGRCEGELRLEIFGELAPHLAAREEVVERFEGAGAAGVELEHLLVGADGVIGAPELRVVDLRHRGVETLAASGVAGLLDPPLDDADEVLPSARPREQTIERGERRPVVRVDGQNLVVSGRRLVDIAETIVDAGDSQPVIPGERRVGHACGELCVEPDQSALRTGALRDFLDFVAGFRERGIVAKRRREHGERLSGVVHSIGADARCLALERDPLFQVGLAGAEYLENPDELRPVPALFVNRLENGRRLRAQLAPQHRFERLTRRFVVGIDEEDLAVVLEGACGVVKVLFEGLAEPELRNR